MTSSIPRPQLRVGSSVMLCESLAYDMALDGNPSDKECWRSLEFAFEERGDYVGADEVRRRGEARVGI